MNGQTMSFKDKQNIIDQFIERVPPYEQLTPLQFDMRGYADYVRENNIPIEEIDERVYSRFRK